MIELSIIIPVFNEELNIGPLYERLKKTVDMINISYEIIFVNDGSIDNSFDLIKKISHTEPFIKYIDFSRNFGHQIAVTAGLDLSVGNAVAIIDADLQDPPELIENLYEKFREGFQVVYAMRKHRKGGSFIKKLLYKAFYRILQKITLINIPLDTGDFRIIDRKIVEILKKMPEYQKFIRGQIAWIGFNQTCVEYDRDERFAGTPSYTYRKLIKLALDGITSFSNFPLRFATISGFIVSAFSFVMIIIALYMRLFTGSVIQGWASMVIIVLFIGGIQLISIGIIGEYISRIIENVRNRPLYIIKETNIACD